MADLPETRLRTDIDKLRTDLERMTEDLVKTRKALQDVIGKQGVLDPPRAIVQQNQRLVTMNNLLRAARMGARFAVGAQTGQVGQDFIQAALAFAPPQVRMVVGAMRLASYISQVGANATMARAQLDSASVDSDKLRRLRTNPIDPVSDKEKGLEISRLKSARQFADRSWAATKHDSITALQNYLSMGATESEYKQKELEIRKHAMAVVDNWNLPEAQKQQWMANPEVSQMDTRKATLELSNTWEGSTVYGAAYAYQFGANGGNEQDAREIALGAVQIHYQNTGRFEQLALSYANKRKLQEITRQAQIWAEADQAASAEISTPRTGFKLLEDRRRSEWLFRIQKPRVAPVARD